MTEDAQLKIGDERVVTIGPIAHGGHFIAHSDGRTLFVRHAITGETVRVRVTDINRKMVRADAIFAATGVTKGALLDGVSYKDGFVHTHTLVMNSATRTVREVRMKRPV